jgi:hypothetical protein
MAVMRTIGLLRWFIGFGPPLLINGECHCSHESRCSSRARTKSTHDRRSIRRPAAFQDRRLRPRRTRNPGGGEIAIIADHMFPDAQAGLAMKQLSD